VRTFRVRFMNLSLGLFSNRSMLTIFISFSTIDGQDVAEHIHSSYKKVGYKVFLSSKEIPYA
jgi:hypothetical protein